MNIQQEIYKAVARRGYRDGWTAGQFAARQVAKLTEELGELLAHVHTVAEVKMDWEDRVFEAARHARRWFDRGNWEYAYVKSAHDAIDELADIVVVACCLAEALGEHKAGMDVNLMDLALSKARADVVRGVRSEKAEKSPDRLTTQGDDMENEENQNVDVIANLEGDGSVYVYDINTGQVVWECDDAIKLYQIVKWWESQQDDQG
jgi:NTP pyrophosphatase (non-canonical NTP hydrolase)